MSNVKGLKRTCLLLIALIIVSGSVKSAIVHNEGPDAGELLGSAQFTAIDVEEIFGNIDYLGDVDLYQLTFSEPAIVTVDVTKPGTFFDEDTFIFNKTGNPIVNKDAPVFQFTAAVAGIYYLGICDWNTVATDSDGNIIADDYYKVLNPAGILGGWKCMSDPLRKGEYKITLRTEIIPEPCSILLLGMGSFLPFVRKK